MQIGGVAIGQIELEHFMARVRGISLQIFDRDIARAAQILKARRGALAAAMAAVTPAICEAHAVLNGGLLGHLLRRRYAREGREEKYGKNFSASKMHQCSTLCGRLRPFCDNKNDVLNDESMDIKPIEMPE
ncbi:MAG: hypothetical protein ACK4NA_03605 [Alphaproteobacteria bacterium]